MKRPLKSWEFTATHAGMVTCPNGHRVSGGCGRSRQVEGPYKGKMIRSCTRCKYAEEGHGN